MLLLLYACDSERGPREPTEEVSYSGYIYRGPTSADDDVLDEGGVIFSVAGEAVPAEQPYDGYPGYWSAMVAGGVPFELLITSADAWPVRWAGTTPTNNGSWFSGALFAGDATQVAEFVTLLQVPGAEAVDLGDTSVVHVIGSAWDGEDWDCALLTVNGMAPTCYLQDEKSGEVQVVTSGPVTFFATLGLPPGEIVVDSGLGARQAWQADGGQIVYAFWFTGVPA